MVTKLSLEVHMYFSLCIDSIPSVGYTIYGLCNVHGSMQCMGSYIHICWVCMCQEIYLFSMNFVLTATYVHAISGNVAIVIHALY